MFEKYWSLFLTAAIGLIIIEHPYLGIGLSFVGFALARYEGGVHGDTFSIEAQKHETVDGSASA